MIVFNDVDEINLPTDTHTCVTIGNFDGIHRGHQELIKESVDFSKKNGFKSVVFTFANHPANYFKPGHVKKIVNNKDKMDVMKSLGVDIYLNMPFDDRMTKISAEEYVKDILLHKLHAKKVVIGHDFTFARKKEGNADTMSYLGKKYGFDVEVVSPVKVDGERISSTSIRKLIESGEVDEANRLLARRFSVEGEVIHARQLGRTMGFPTANILYDKDMVIPAIGVYATAVEVDKKLYMGATSVGKNPTVTDEDKITIETYILNFDEDIYGKILKVGFVKRLRGEIKFSGLDELRNQLDKDVVNVKEVFDRNFSL